VLAGCTRSADEPDRPLEILTTSAAETLDPRYSTDAVGLRATRLVHAGLFGIDRATLAPYPLVAKTYRFEGPQELHVTLRAGVRFHGGKELDSGDVVATLAAFADPKVASRHARVVSAIARAEAEGPLGVKIVLARPHATLLTDLELPVLRADQAASPPAPDGTLDGLGPFEITRSEAGVIELQPRATGVFPAPKHAITLRAVRDENARALRLHAGRADLVQNGFSPTLLPSFDRAGLQVVARPSASLTYLVPRCDRGPMQDTRVRRAVSLAVDRAMLARALFAGHATPASTLLPPGHWARPHVPEAGPRDVEGARRLLREAGAEGARVSLLVSTDRARKLMARVLAAELEEVGLSVEITSLELGTMLGRLGSGDFELAMLQLPEVIEPNVLRVFLHGEFVPPAGSNRGRVRSARLDALLDQGDARHDEDARKEIYAEVEALVRQEALWIPLVHEDHVAVVSPRASAYAPDRDGRWGGLFDLP
jgi:peptide/nickel transport system substrate-binding protein